MTSKRPSTTADDFKQISGIGPAIERRLHQAGVLTYAQLAATSPADLSEIVSDLAGMSAERIQQQEWIHQARSLAVESAQDGLQPGDAVSSGNGQHYAAFTVELLLDKSNDVRRTRVVHVQSQEDEAWAGWQMGRLAQFIVDRAGLNVSPEPEATVESLPPATAKPEAAPAPAGDRSLSRSRYALQRGPVDLDRMVLTRVATPASEPQVEKRPQPPRPGGHPHLQSFQVVPSGTENPSTLLSHDRPFDVRLDVDMSSLETAGATPLTYRATVYASDLGGGPRQTLGESQGAVTRTGNLAIQIPGTFLKPGTYRLEAEMALTFVPQAPDLKTSLKGSLLQIY